MVGLRPKKKEIQDEMNHTIQYKKLDEITSCPKLVLLLAIQCKLLATPLLSILVFDSKNRISESKTGFLGNYESIALTN